MSDCNGVDTPSTATPSENDFDGDPFTETWQYNSIIGMLMYLSANTRPDIAYAVHQAARFSHAPRHSHAIAVRRILRYLQKTKTMGLLLKPTNTQRVDCYVDADFAGLFAVENNQDPISVKSRTGYVVLYKGSPLLWVSKMQTQIALSTMEAEYVALSQAMRYLIPIREIWPLHPKFNQVLHIMRIPNLSQMLRRVLFLIMPLINQSSMRITMLV